MPLQVQCPNPACRGVSVLDDKLVGADTRCTACGTTFHVTAPPTVAPRPAPSTIQPVAATKQTQDGGAPSSASAKPPATSGSSKRIGRFEIRARLGAGAFGVVYRAFDPQLKREVALKVLHPEMLNHPNRVARFQREAQSAAQLRHANIVPVFDIGQDGGQYYIASAYIPGQTLHDALDDQPMPSQRAARIMRDLADAVGYAHQQGVVHRDLKPANILLDEKDSPQLVDFGLSARQETEPQEKANRLTRLGAVLGTPAYMAPEQAGGQTGEVQPAADQYSLGIILYELLCGRPPFEGPPDLVIYNVLHKEPATPCSVNASVPPELELICLKAMARRPEDRYTDCQALADALRRWLEESNTPVPAVNKEAPPVRAVNKEATPVRAVRNERTSVEVRKALLARQTLIPAVKPSTTKKWLIVAGAAGVAFLALFVLIGLVGLWKSGVFKVKTKDGTIVLENLPPDADVTVDGEKVTVKSGEGKTFEVRVDASKKKHRLEIKKDGFKVFGDEVEVEAGGRKAVMVRLEPMPPPIPTEKTKDGTIVLENLPADADVTVDGKEVPVTPGDGKTFEVHVDASKNKHRLEVKKHGFKDFGEDVEVDAGGRKSIVVRLEPNAQPMPPDKQPGDDKEKWVSLFNGKDLTGWKTHPKQPGDWRVENGVLLNSGSASGGLYSERNDYKDFHLRVEVRINDESSGGVHFRAPFDGPAGYRAYIDCTDTTTTGGRKTGGLGPGKAHPILVSVDKSPVRAREWFTMEIIANGSHLVIKVNEKTTADYEDQELLYTSGHFILAKSEKVVIEFRKIEIKELPPRKRTAPSRLAIGSEKGWRIEGKELFHYSRDDRSGLLFGDPDWQDYDFTVDAMRVAGNEDLSVIFRAADWTHGYWCGFGTYGNQWYEVSSEEQVAPERRRIGDPIRGGVQSNRWYTILVKVRETHCEVFLDGKRVFDFKDARYPRGRVGLRTALTAVRFRNIKVTAPDGEVLWEGLPDLPGGQ